MSILLNKRLNYILIIRTSLNNAVIMIHLHGRITKQTIAVKVSNKRMIPIFQRYIVASIGMVSVVSKKVLPLVLPQFLMNGWTGNASTSGEQIAAIISDLSKYGKMVVGALSLLLPLSLLF